VPQALLKAGKDGLVVAALKIDGPAGLQAHLSERRRKEIWTGDAPEHFALGAGGNPGREKCRCCAVNSAVSPAGNLMQSAAPQPASGKP
jgi:hypothetical protein